MPAGHRACRAHLTSRTYRLPSLRNSRLGITGALCLDNGIFLQQLEGDKAVVNALYHRSLLDRRHRETAVLDFSEIMSRRFVSWSMASLPLSRKNRQVFLKYSSSPEFDPYNMTCTTLRAFFDEIQTNVRWLG
ncbi:MAG: blue light sensor protein [Polaromonas sp.]|jgi:hypothetical protein|nr:blue light sensor protein [Polaromonas sp.]